MHQMILGDEISEGALGDHIDGDGLNNRRSNLRVATRQQNVWNRRPNRNKASGIKGVARYKDGKRWKAQIKFQGTNYHLGIFDTPDEAAKAYNEKAQELFGEYAWLNHTEGEQQYV